MIDAADSRQLEAALAQLAGGLAGRLNGLRDAMLDLLAHLEAGLDFPDEEIEFITRDELDRQLQEASRTISQLLRQMTERGQAGDLSRVVLVGSPNTGKSSLFNALAEAGRAIVSDHPGTTRDYVAAELDLDGLRCLLLDTAGVEPNSDAPRRAAVWFPLRSPAIPSALPTEDPTPRRSASRRRQFPPRRPGPPNYKSSASTPPARSTPGKRPKSLIPRGESWS